jgi:hypothetical protein
MRGLAAECIQQAIVAGCWRLVAWLVFGVAHHRSCSHSQDMGALILASPIGLDQPRHSRLEAGEPSVNSWLGFADSENYCVIAA